MGEEAVPLQVVVLGMRDPGRAVLVHAMAASGHRAVPSWSFQHVQPLLVSRHYDALLVLTGTGQVPRRLLAQIVAETPEPRRTALIAVGPGPAHGQIDDWRRMGFDHFLPETTPPAALVAAVLDAARPYRPPPVLDTAHRQGLDAAALPGLDAAFEALAATLDAQEDEAEAAVADWAARIRAASLAAGLAAAARAAAELAGEPARPYRLRMMGIAIRDARQALDAERLRDGIEDPI
jgi:hypothetical protein